MDASVRGCEPRLHEDALLQTAVLTILLDAHPAQRSADELVREVTAEPGDFAQRDAVENAIRELVAAGLVHRHDEFVFATRAAARFDQLRP
jgi:Fe2+ or Zn2+ uptake regulation protein